MFSFSQDQREEEEGGYQRETVPQKPREDFKTFQKKRKVAELYEKELEYKEEIAELKRRKERLTRELEMERKKNLEWEKSYSASNRLNETLRVEYTRLLEKLNEYEQQQTGKEKELNTSSYILMEETHATSLFNRSNESIELQAALEKKLHEAKYQIANLEKQIEQKNVTIDNLTLQLNNYEKEHSIVRSNIAEISLIKKLRKIVDEKEEAIKKIEQEKEREIEQERKKFEQEKEEEMERWKKRVQELKIEYEKLIEEKRKLIEEKDEKIRKLEKEKENEITEWKEKVQILESECEKLNKEKEEFLSNKEKMEKELLDYERRVGRGEYNKENLKVLHMSINPETLAKAKHSNDELERMKAENKILKERVEKLESMNTNTSEDNSEYKEKWQQADKMNQRLKEAFQLQIKKFRTGIYRLFGYRVDITDDKFRLISMYAERPDDFLLFKDNDSVGLELMESDYASQIEPRLLDYLNTYQSIPLFLSQITIELFNKQTVMSGAKLRSDQ